MGKRTLILTSETKMSVDNYNEEKYLEYAKQHDLDIIDRMHYPWDTSFLEPELIVNVAMRVNPEVVISDDVDFIVANAYHDGRLVKMFEEKGVSVISTETSMSFSEINSMIDDETVDKIKRFIDDAIERSAIMEGKRIAVMTIDSTTDEFSNFRDELSKVSEKVCVIQLPQFYPFMSEAMDFIMKNSDITKVIIYDEELMTKNMKQYLSKLQTEDNIEVFMKDDYDMKNAQTLKSQIMKLN